MKKNKTIKNNTKTTKQQVKDMINSALLNIKINGNTKVNRRRNPRIGAYNRQKRAIPMANTRGFNKRFYVDRLTATTARVSGSDLVYAIPDTLVTGSATNVITVIPCNPAYWLGTRVAAIASGYQNYRPIQFNVHYVPQVAVTQQGNVIGGTLWYDAPPITNLQQTLRTSNGGFMTQCYKNANANVRLKSNLQYNLYRMGGNIDQQSMPFLYIAIAVACRTNSNQHIIPGYFYVDYSFIFKNPTGPSTIYYNSGLTMYSNITASLRANNVCVLCSQLVAENATLNIGTILDIEYDQNLDAYNFRYNNSSVDTPAGYIWVFSNGPNTALTYQQMKRMTKIPIYYDSIEEPQTDTMVIPPQTAGFYVEDNQWVNILVNNGNTPITQQVTNLIKYYLSEDLAQNYGNLSSLIGDTIEFLADLTDYYLVLADKNTRKKTSLNKNQNILNESRIIET